MKYAFVALIALVLSAQVAAKELFAARCVPALTKGEFTWRVEESRRGVLVRHSDPKKTYSTELRGADADVLRTKIAGLHFSRADVDFLRAREIKTTDGMLLLRPFDGVMYHFTMPVGGLVSIDNPSFDLEHHPMLEETVRLSAVLEFLEQLTRVAKSENG